MNNGQKFRFLNEFRFSASLPNLGPLSYKLSDWSALLKSVQSIDNLIDTLSKERPILKEFDWTETDKAFLSFYSRLACCPYKLGKVKCIYEENGRTFYLILDVVGAFTRVCHDLSNTVYTGIDCSAISNAKKRQKFKSIFGDELRFENLKILGYVNPRKYFWKDLLFLLRNS